MGNEARSRVASGKHGHTLISDAKFRRLYELALQFEHRGPGDGLRASLAGVAADLRNDDTVVAEEPATAAWLDPRGWRQPDSGDFSERVIAALGGALADRVRRNGRLTVIVGSGRGSDPIVREAHQIADEARLPVLFVEDCRKAENGSAGKRASAPLPQRIGAMPAIPVDADDVIALYRVAHESIARAREGSGPTRIQCVRWTLQNASDKTTAVRHLEQWLEARGLPAQAWRREIVAALQTAGQKTAPDDPGATDQNMQELRSA